MTYSNPEIARLRRSDVRALMVPGFISGVDAVVCVGTNLRSAYLVDECEKEFGIPVIDSAAATLWQLLKVAGIHPNLAGWGSLLSA